MSLQDVQDKFKVSVYLFTLGVMQVFSIIVFNSASSLIKISSRMTRLYKSGRLQEETRLERGARVQEMCAGAMGTKEDVYLLLQGTIKGIYYDWICF